MTGSVMVGYDFSKTEDTGVLIIGKKKPDGSTEVINAFSGKEAIDMLKKLVGDGGDKIWIC